MSEYVPTTEQVRQFWASEGTYVPAAKSEDYVVSAVEFDRWLDQVKATARSEGLAQGWDEAYGQGIWDERTSEDNIGIAGLGGKVGPCRSNPYLEDRHVDQ